MINRLLPYLIVILFIALSVGSASSESLTYDEIVHTQEGVSALTKHSFLVDTNNPPLIRELAMLPTVLGFGKQLPPRMVIILLGVLTLLAVYTFSKSYFARTQALFALFLLALEPTFLGNSHYVTLDTGATLFFFLGYASFVRLMEHFSVGNVAITAFAWGLAFASKMTAIPFMIISSVLTGLFVFRNSFRKFWESSRHVLIFVCVIGLVIWATYFFEFDVIIASREDPGRVSSRLHAYAVAHKNTLLENVLTFGEKQKLPLGNYFAVIKNTLLWPKARPRIFYWGNFYSSSRWYFMAITILLKLPIPLLLFFIVGLLRSSQWRRIAVCAIPVFVILGVTSFVNNQPWIRYVLPAIPFFVIVASHGITWFSTPIQKLVFIVLCLWYAYGTAMAYPHFISYANEFVGPHESRYRIFMDSNLDWGQSLPDFKRYIETIKPGFISFSYFGRDNADDYGFTSDKSYGSHKFEEICAFHHINFPNTSQNAFVAISVSNWYYCGYYKDPRYVYKNVRYVVADSILIFKPAASVQ